MLTLFVLECIIKVREKGNVMSTTVMLHKERANYAWSYIIDHKYYVAVTPRGSLLEQMVHVLTEIQDTFDLFGKEVTVVSTTLLRSVLYDLTLSFPSMRFVPVADSEVARVFRNVMNRAGEDKGLVRRKTRNSNTLYICSDASKSASHNMCGWAWFSTVEGSSGYGFGVSEHRSTVSAELEGILHAIIDNSGVKQKNLHIYCDSQRSVEWAQALLSKRLTTTKIGAASGRLLALVHEARKVVEVKNVTVEWVRGHRSHRLNVAADYLSREARIAAGHHKKLRKDAPQVTAIVSFIDQ